MLRMSFMEHLEELRNRILHMLGGVVVIFFVSLIFCNQLWDIIKRARGGRAEAAEDQSAQPRPDLADGHLQHHLDEAAPAVRDFSRLALDPLPGLEIHFPGIVQEGTALGRALHPQHRRTLHHGRSFRLFRRFPLRAGLSVGSRHVRETFSR